MPCRGACWTQTDVNLYEHAACADEPPCKLMRCPNYAVCNNIQPLWMHDCHNGRCYDCDLTYGRDLRIFPQPPAQLLQCPVCLDCAPRMSFVKYACEHPLCTRCFGDAMLRRETPAVDPRRYGFRPPASSSRHGASPRERWSAVEMQGWAAESPVQHRRYMYVSRTTEILTADDNAARVASVKRCPICRDERPLQ